MTVVTMQIQATTRATRTSDEGERRRAHAVGVVAEGAAVDGVGADDQAAAEEVGPGGGGRRPGEGDGGRADLERARPRVARPMVSGRRKRKAPAMARKREDLGEAVARRRCVEPLGVDAASRTTHSAAAADEQRGARGDATIQSRPTTLWSPEPRTTASPVAAGAGAVGSEDAGAAAGASSVTVMQAPGTRDGWSGSGI